MPPAVHRCAVGSHRQTFFFSNVSDAHNKNWVYSPKSWNSYSWFAIRLYNGFGWLAYATRKPPERWRSKYKILINFVICSRLLLYCNITMSLASLSGAMPITAHPTSQLSLLLFLKMSNIVDNVSFSGRLQYFRRTYSLFSLAGYWKALKRVTRAVANAYCSIKTWHFKLTMPIYLTFVTSSVTSSWFRILPYQLDSKLDPYTIQNILSCLTDDWCWCPGNQVVNQPPQPRAFKFFEFWSLILFSQDHYDNVLILTIICIVLLLYRISNTLGKILFADWRPSFSIVIGKSCCQNACMTLSPATAS